jgi:hypothetical protein
MLGIVRVDASQRSHWLANLPSCCRSYCRNSYRHLRNVVMTSPFLHPSKHVKMAGVVHSDDERRGGRRPDKRGMFSS